MQARAILEAACDVTKEGGKTVAEIMIPLVGDVLELRDQSEIVRRVAADVMKERGVKVKDLVGTMIEVPRGSIVADEIAREAEFFSFGTNDLTQLTYGFSRDDFGKVLKVYRDRKILERIRSCRSTSRASGSSLDGHEERPGLAAGPQDRRLRRTWRRPGLDSLLRRGGARLRELQDRFASRWRGSRRHMPH